VSVFADIEALVVGYLENTTGTRTVTTLPTLLEAGMPIYRVTVVGGVDDTITDRVRLTVESFAATRAASYDLAETGRQALHTMAHTLVSGWLIDTVETVARPTWIDYANDHVQRFIAMYEVSSRVHAS